MDRQQNAFGRREIVHNTQRQSSMQRLLIAQDAKKLSNIMTDHMKLSRQDNGSVNTG
jgi:hypothetical protein